MAHIKPPVRRRPSPIPSLGRRRVHGGLSVRRATVAGCAARGLGGRAHLHALRRQASAPRGIARLVPTALRPAAAAHPSPPGRSGMVNGAEGAFAAIIATYVAEPEVDGQNGEGVELLFPVRARRFHTARTRSFLTREARRVAVGHGGWIHHAGGVVLQILSLHHADRRVSDGRLLLRPRRRHRTLAAPPFLRRPRQRQGAC